MSPKAWEPPARQRSLAVLVLFAVWYAAPWMNRRTLAVTLSAPLLDPA